MRVLFDTNVVLDVLLERQPFLASSALSFARAEAGEVQGFLCATTVTTIFYLTEKAQGQEAAFQAVRALLAFLEIAPVHRPVLDQASELGFSDFEDAVLHEAARHVHAVAIVSRNTRHFRGGALPAYSPEDFNRAMDLQGSEVHEPPW